MLFVAEGSGEMTDLKSAFAIKLTLSRAGFKLQMPLIELIVNHLVDVVRVKDVKDVADADLIDTAKEAWAIENDGGALPVAYLRALQRWLGVAGPPPGLSKAPSEVDGYMDLGGDFETDEFGGVEHARRDEELLRSDMKEQKLSAPRLVGMSLGIELGQTVTVDQAILALKYKGDARITEQAKAQRKASIMTLSKLLADTKTEDLRGELNDHFVALIRDYSELGWVEEASLVTAWWAETQAISPDNMVLAKYLHEYFRKYPGRGLPKPVDVVIALRVMSSARAGVSADAFDKLKTKVTELSNALSSTKSEVGSLRSELGRVKNSKTGSQGMDFFNGKCNLCGEFGHRAAKCPNQEKSSGKKKGKEKEEDDEKSDD